MNVTNMTSKCVGCEEPIGVENGPAGIYDGRFELCMRCGERVMEIQKIAALNQDEKAFKDARALFLMKYPSFVR